jgi:hypothetical protein
MRSDLQGMVMLFLGMDGDSLTPSLEMPDAAMECAATQHADQPVASTACNISMVSLISPT